MSILTVDELYAAQDRIHGIILGCKGVKRWELIRDFYMDGQWYSGVVDWEDRKVYYWPRPKMGLGPLGSLQDGQTET